MELDGITFVIEKELAAQLTKLSIDYRESRWTGSGFFIQPTYADKHAIGTGCC